MSTPIPSSRVPGYPADPLFTGRWSPRAFTGEAIPLETLMTCFEAARWAPSAMNHQPWRFVYGLRGTPAFDAILAGLMPMNQAWARNASALVVMLAKTTATAPGQTEAKPNAWHAFDAGAAWASFAFQAYQLGWMTHGMGGFVADTLRPSLALPEDVAIQAVVAIGKQGDKSQLPEALQAREQPSPRKPLSELVAEGRWTLG
ncbi:nitroreductase family protein [Ideonella livida]|uniref:Nitroreductase family protein n=1 Tax=Ideonella livida TaxID=2707176 RepID=A0A7C9THY8_9BURK|nr:nitroreductase family protein [Ideonella livida]NDY90860.1 nitroreductase family protein [Ideonella livida]